MAPPSLYNQEQAEAIVMVKQHLAGLSVSQLRWLKRRLRAYLQFRAAAARFQEQYFAGICTEKCFSNQTSGCCGREGIITFFADVVVNVLLSTPAEIDLLLEALAKDAVGFNCVYLTETGCLWRLEPIVCEMFLCEYARKSVLHGNKALQWQRLRRRKRRYTWPNRPVLFDELESFFLEAGLDSPLMYFHHSPGLLRVKNKFDRVRLQCSRVRRRHQI